MGVLLDLRAVLRAMLGLPPVVNWMSCPFGPVGGGGLNASWSLPALNFGEGEGMGIEVWLEDEEAEVSSCTVGKALSLSSITVPLW